MPDLKSQDRPASAGHTLDDEPEPTSEADVPSDGRDHQGEAMIRDLPQRTGRPESDPQKEH